MNLLQHRGVLGESVAAQVVELFPLCFLHKSGWGVGVGVFCSVLLVC